MEIKFDKFEEQVFFNTVRIENLTDKELGTGFLLQMKVDENRVRHLLFTNKHVIWGRKDYSEKTYLMGGKEKLLQITVHTNNKDGTYSLGNTITFKIQLKRGQEGYWEDEKHEVDVACFNVSDGYNTHSINMRSAELKDFNDYTFDQIQAGTKIIFVGYPTGFYDRKNSLPVLRSGVIASIPSIDFNGFPQILLDAQVFPGSSGSPVFTQINGKYKLLGIINAAQFSPIQFMEVASEKTSQQQETFSSPTKVIPVQPIGLGMLFKISVISDICGKISSQKK